jgi:hypothetical protein
VSVACPLAPTLFYSLLNTALSYDPVGWGVPYASAIVSDTEEPLADISLQVRSSVECAGACINEEGSRVCCGVVLRVVCVGACINEKGSRVCCGVVLRVVCVGACISEKGSRVCCGVVWCSVCGGRGKGGRGGCICVRTSRGRFGVVVYVWEWCSCVGR